MIAVDTSSLIAFLAGAHSPDPDLAPPNKGGTGGSFATRGVCPFRL